MRERKKGRNENGEKGGQGRKRWKGEEKLGRRENGLENGR